MWCRRPTPIAGRCTSGWSSRAPASPMMRRSSLRSRSSGPYHTEHNLWEDVPPDVFPALERLRRLGVTLAVASNANGALHRAFDRLGLTPHFHAICDSCVEGAEKPDPRFFEIVLQRSGGRPETTLHVGDLYHVDVVGAQRAGLRAALMDPHDSIVVSTSDGSGARRRGSPGWWLVVVRGWELGVGSWELTLTTNYQPPTTDREKTVRRIVGLGRVGIAQLVEKRAERRKIGLVHLEAGEHAAEIGAVIAVVEQADVPAPAELLEKLRAARRGARGTRTGRAARCAPPARGHRPCGARAASPSRCR